MIINGIEVGGGGTASGSSGTSGASGTSGVSGTAGTSGSSGITQINVDGGSANSIYGGIPVINGGGA